jgi:hypothetical protein
MPDGAHRLMDYLALFSAGYKPEQYPQPRIPQEAGVICQLIQEPFLAFV